MDLDRFKAVNDTLGHPAGDALLQETAARLKDLLRETDVLARLGGDEFVIIQVCETKQREAASALANRILDVFTKPFNINGNEIYIGVSIGIALSPEQATNPDDLLKMADMALYRVMAAGRNSYRFFDLEMNELANTRRTGARSTASRTSSHLQSWADCITGTHESSFWKRQLNVVLLNPV